VAPEPTLVKHLKMFFQAWETRPYFCIFKMQQANFTAYAAIV
jgi:hypothetical protein